MTGWIFKIRLEVFKTELSESKGDLEIEKALHEADLLCEKAKQSQEIDVLSSNTMQCRLDTQSQQLEFAKTNIAHFANQVKIMEEVVGT